MPVTVVSYKSDSFAWDGYDYHNGVVHYMAKPNNIIHYKRWITVRRRSGYLIITSERADTAIESIPAPLLNDEIKYLYGHHCSCKVMPSDFESFIVGLESGIVNQKYVVRIKDE